MTTETIESLRAALLTTPQVKLSGAQLSDLGYSEPFVDWDEYEMFVPLTAIEVALDAALASVTSEGATA